MPKTNTKDTLKKLEEIIKKSKELNKQARELKKRIMSELDKKKIDQVRQKIAGIKA
jgi:hypothetical protein